MASKNISLFVGSSPCDRDSFKKGLHYFKRNYGKSAVIDPEILRLACRSESKIRPFIAGSDQEKARLFSKIWNRTDTTSILGIRGGYGCLRLLPYLDKLKLKKRKDVRVFGFSDFTILQHYLYSRFKSPWVHSPFLSSRSFFESEKQEQLISQNNSLKFQWISKTKNRVPSRTLLLGGNLACLVSMIGTPWEPKVNQKFFCFLEDVNEKPYRVDRLLQQLANSRFFKNCQGVILGHFSESEKVIPLITLWGNENNILVGEGLLAGHERPNCPISLGNTVEFLAGSNKTNYILRFPSPSLL